MAYVFTESHLKTFLPNALEAAAWTAALGTAMERFEINSSARAAAFLAQIAHESGELRHVVENLNYSAKTLMRVWPKRFPTPEKAAEYARQPEKLANYVYAKRLGNGDSATGDGWRFRGRGLLQITGRGNYRSCGRALDLPLEAEPEQLESPPVAALAAAQFWSARGLNELADDRNDDDDDEDFVRISIIINGGRVGLPERRRYWARARVAVLDGVPV